MRGVSGVIVVILLLMISVALAGAAYTFLSATMASTTSSASSAVSATTSSMLTSFVIESVDVAKLYVRNTGQSDLSNISVYVNDALAHFNVTPSIIKAGQIGTVTIYDFIQANDDIKVTTANGFLRRRTAPIRAPKRVGCWKLDEGSGMTAYDSSGNGNSGSVNGASWISGKYGNALTFRGDGYSDYVAFPASITAFGGDYTIMVWFRNSDLDLTHGRDIFSQRENPDVTVDVISLFHSTDSMLYFNIRNNGVVVQSVYSSTGASYGVWHLAVVERKGNSMLMFLDGTNVTTGSSITGVIPAFNPSTTLNFGMTSGYYGYVFEGQEDEARIYNRAIY